MYRGCYTKLPKEGGVTRFHVEVLSRYVNQDQEIFLRIFILILDFSVSRYQNAQRMCSYTFEMPKKKERKANAGTHRKASLGNIIRQGNPLCFKNSLLYDWLAFHPSTNRLRKFSRNAG